MVAEAVTMFVNQQRAAGELARVARPGGRVLATEFYWRRPRLRRRGTCSWVCAGLRFDSVEEWEEIYAGAGLVDVRAEAGPYAMMTPRGFLTDEGGTQLR